MGKLVKERRGEKRKRKGRKDTHLFIGGVRKRNNLHNSAWASRAVGVALSTCMKFTGNIKSNKEKCIICADSELQKFCWRNYLPSPVSSSCRITSTLSHPERPVNQGLYTHGHVLLLDYHRWTISGKVWPGCQVHFISCAEGHDFEIDSKRTVKISKVVIVSH